MLCMASLTIISATAQQKITSISDIEETSSWIYVYNQNGQRAYARGAANSGKVVGWSGSLWITRRGNWYYLWSIEGKQYKTLSVSSVGEIQSVSGNTFTAKSGSWIYTYDKNGKRIHTRNAR